MPLSFECGFVRCFHTSLECQVHLCASPALFRGRNAEHVKVSLCGRFQTHVSEERLPKRASIGYCAGAQLPGSPCRPRLWQTRPRKAHKTPTTKKEATRNCLQVESRRGQNSCQHPKFTETPTHERRDLACHGTRRPEMGLRGMRLTTPVAARTTAEPMTAGQTIHATTNAALTTMTEEDDYDIPLMLSQIIESSASKNRDNHNNNQQQNNKQCSSDAIKNHISSSSAGTGPLHFKWHEACSCNTWTNGFCKMRTSCQPKIMHTGFAQCRLNERSLSMSLSLQGT